MNKYEQLGALGMATPRTGRARRALQRAEKACLKASQAEEKATLLLQLAGATNTLETAARAVSALRASVRRQKAAHREQTDTLGCQFLQSSRMGRLQEVS